MADGPVPASAPMDPQGEAFSAPRPTTPPVAGVVELGRLGGRLLAALLRSPFRWSGGEVFGRWLHDLLERHGAEGVLLKIGPKRLLLVGGPGLSRAILDPPPSRHGYVAGGLKVGAMSFLADRALTVVDGEAWTRLRSLNEEVLATGRVHPHAATHLATVRGAFPGPVRSVEELRQGMGEVMLRVVLGERAPARLAADIQTLFSMVQSPLKRRIFRHRGERLRARFFADLQEAWRSPNAGRAPTLLGSARECGSALEDEEILHQVPHWMFTFTGSGTDLLLRGMALLGSRPTCLERALQEITSAGFPEDPSAPARMDYLEACLLEGGRLFSPVTRTFHSAPAGAQGAGYRVPPRVEILHYLPLLHRYGHNRPDAHAFRPERWLDEGEERPYPGIFLSGSRACPGRELILHICKSVAATLLGNGVRLRASGLEQDPVPLTFPERRLVFS